MQQIKKKVKHVNEHKEYGRSTRPRAHMHIPMLTRIPDTRKNENLITIRKIPTIRYYQQ